MKSLLVAVLLCLFLATPAAAKEKATKTETRGWVDGKYVQLRSKETKKEKVTRGWVDGKYIHIREKKKKD